MQRCQRRTTSLQCCVEQDAALLPRRAPAVEGGIQTSCRSASTCAWSASFFVIQYAKDVFCFGGQRGHFSGADVELVSHNFVLIFEEAALGGTESTRAISVIDATVAGAHEKSRLREPADGTSEMRAVNGEDLERRGIDMPHPARDFRGVAIPGVVIGIFVCGEPCFSHGESIDGPKRYPR